jgi:hypothetical protein
VVQHTAVASRLFSEFVHRVSFGIHKLAHSTYPQYHKPLGFGRVRYNHPSQVSQRGESLRDVAVGRPLEIEEYWDQPAFPDFVAYGVKNWPALFVEATGSKPALSPTVSNTSRIFCLLRMRYKNCPTSRLPAVMTFSPAGVITKSSARRPQA